jgi:methanogenic corrinoid protein MtbC1
MFLGECKCEVKIGLGSLAAVVDLRERYVDALVDGDPASAAALVHAAIADGVDVRRLYLQVLQPALYEIGRRWERAEISIAQEHLATATTQSLMARLAERLDADRRPRRERTVLVAGAEGELHSIGARMVADFLEADGWDVLFVGALSPVDALAEMAAERGVDVVAVSASLSERLPEVASAVRALSALDPRPLIAVGGQAFAGEPAAALATGADLYANNADALVRTLAERF